MKTGTTVSRIDPHTPEAERADTDRCDAAPRTAEELARSRRLAFIRGETERGRDVLRQEHKFLMSTLEYKKLAGRLAKCLALDPHNGSTGYMVRSLYFDTLGNSDYEEKLDGSELRRKFRLRVYDTRSDGAYFEMKQKQGMYQRKRSLKLSRADAELMANGIYTPLLKYNAPFAAECFALLNLRAYRPKVIVQYDRYAFIAKENETRITFDHSLCANEGSTDIFSDRLCLYPILDPYAAVMEVKYNHLLLHYIKELIKEADKSAMSVGKYFLARSITQS